MLIRLSFLFFILLFNLLISEEENLLEDAFESSLDETESLIPTLVNNTVSVISGEWVESENDFYIAGPEPLLLNRSYAFKYSPRLNLKSLKPAPALRDFNCGHKWFFNHPSFLQIKKKYSSDDKNYKIDAFFSHNSGIRTQHHKTISSKRFKTDSILIAPKSKKGMTNCYTSEISGRTNLNNTNIHYDYANKSCIAVTGKGDSVFFNWHDIKGRTNKIFLRPIAERKVSGNFLTYTDNEILVKDESQKVIFSYLKFSNVENKNIIEVKASDGKEASYTFECLRPTIKPDPLSEHAFTPEQTETFSCYLLRKIKFKHKPSVKYNYSNTKHRLVEKIYEDDRFLAASYYGIGKNKLEKLNDIEVDQDNPAFGRIKKLKAPAGHDKTPIIIQQFIYHFDEVVDGKLIGGGSTEVYDALMHKSLYCYNKYEHLTSLQKFRGQKVYKLYSTEEFIWENENDTKASKKSKKKEVIPKGNLIGKCWKDENQNIISARYFDYDHRGNIIADTTYGNLSGHCSVAIQIDAQKKPIQNGAESYTKKFTYSHDAYNLLTCEEEPNGKKIVYQYLPNKDLVEAKFLYDHDQICLREFYEYDSNSALKKVIRDDGSNLDKNSCENVMERHITYLSPKQQMPVGLPEKIENKYYDPITKEEIVLNTWICTYSPEGHLLTKEYADPEGQHFVLNWEYDAHGNVISEVNALQQEITNTYDVNDNLIKKVGPIPGYSEEYSYDCSNRLIQKKEVQPDNVTFLNHYKYDLLGNQISSIDRYGNETKYVYDEFNRLIQTTSPAINGFEDEKIYPATELGYDIFDNITFKKDANGHVTNTTFNAYGKPASISYPDASSEKFYYNLDGNLDHSIAKNGTTTYFERDCLGRVILEKIVSKNHTILSEKSYTYKGKRLIASIDAEKQETIFKYDGAGRLISQSRGDQLVNMEYDCLSRLIKRTTFYGDNEKHVVVETFKYDFLNRVLEEKIEDYFGQIQKRVSYEYDELGNRTKEIAYNDVGDSVKTILYNADKKPVKVIDPQNNCTNFNYDYRCQKGGQYHLKSISNDSLGRQTIHLFNSAGKLGQISNYNSMGLLLSDQELFYDGVGNLVLTKDWIIIEGKKDKFIVTKHVYNSLNQEITLLEALGTNIEKKTTILFNHFGEKEQIIKPDGVTLFHAYDGLGRLQSLNSSDKTIHYTYQYNGNHQVTRVSDRVHIQDTVREYDSNGNLFRETLGNRLAVRYQYDRMNRITNVELPDSSTIKYVYGSLFLNEVQRFKENKKIYTHRYQNYDHSGNLLKAEGPAGFYNYSYDVSQRPTQIIAPFWSQQMQKDSYDAVGRIKKYNAEDVVGKKSYSFEYNDLNSLTREEGHNNHTYATDSLNNRISKDNLLCTTNALNQLVNQGEVNYHYDLNGNLIKKEKGSVISQFTYDALNRLIAVDINGSKTVYQYDSFNRRLFKKGQVDQKFLYMGQNEIGSVVDNKIVELRVLGIGLEGEIGAAVGIELDDQSYAPVHDMNGHVMTLLKDSVPAETYRYTVFGEETIYDANQNEVSESVVENPWRYASKRVDVETGFVYFGQRYYDPDSGRWITPDPLGYADGPNLYSYLHHSPLMAYDAYGLETAYAYEESCKAAQYAPYFAEERDRKERDQQNYDVIRISEGVYSKGLINNCNRSIGFVGGIANTGVSSRQAARRIPQEAGTAVMYAVNRTTVIFDILRAFVELFFFNRTPAEKRLTNMWNQYFMVNPDGYFLQICHSEGAIIVRNALMNYPEDLRNRIIVLAIAPAAYIDKDLCKQVNHYRSTRDFVPLFDIFGASRCAETTTVLKPHPNAPLFDHAYSSPTYAKVISDHIDDFNSKN